MLKFKFEYPVKPIEKYKLRYGLKMKARPYPFKYPVGDDRGGMYRFRYDRRDSVYVEDGEIELVHWGEEMDIDKEMEIAKWEEEMDIDREIEIAKWARDILMGNDFELGNILNKEINKRDTNKELEITFSLLEKFYSKILGKDFEKEIEVEKELILNKTIEKLLDMYSEIIVRKVSLRKLVKENTKKLLKKHLEKGLKIECPSRGLETVFKELLTFSNAIAIERTRKELVREIGKLFFRDRKHNLEKDDSDIKFATTYAEMVTEVMEKLLKLNLIKDLDIFSEKFSEEELAKNFVEEIDIEKVDHELKKSEVETLLTTSLVFAKLKNEMKINQGEKSVFKALNQIYKYNGVFVDAVVLSNVYDMLKELDYTQVELGEEEVKVFEDKSLEKDFEKMLNIEEQLKGLLKETEYKLFKDIKESLLTDETMSDIEIEECFTMVEKIYKAIIDIEKRMMQLDKDFVGELLKEQGFKKLTKKLVDKEILTIEEAKELEKSPIGRILIKHTKKLEKAKRLREIYVENVEIDAIKEAIEVDTSKEKEFNKVIKELDVEEDERKIKFNKRFWFLRATSPKDWKILPYSDYPYKEKPIHFGKNLMPDNWQIDMVHVPKLHEKIDEHPMPFGKDLGREEMALSIEIMIDIINIMILIWSRMFYDFSGYTGSQAVIRFTKILYDWLMLETSIKEMEKKGSKEHYFRCYNWIRWEAEKVAIKARDDMSLSGNHYIDEWIFELIYYMENHHFDTMPIFDVVEKMDEYRALLPSDDPQGDIKFVLDKVKGMRHKILEDRAKKNNE